jgi:hypothetical protein
MRLPARLLLTGAALLVSASCVGDSSVAPSGAPVIGGNPALRALVIAQTVDLVIPAAGGQINVLDVYTLNFPEGAVCDPSADDTQSGYAAGAWDAACTPATSDIAIRATAKWSNGKLYVDFQPALRFVPGKSVMLTTNAFASTVQYYDNAGVTDGWSIAYTTGIDAMSIADALGDQSLRTKVLGNSGKITRRIKHFSGYVLAGGENIPCDPDEGNPLCIWVDDDDLGGTYDER